MSPCTYSVVLALCLATATADSQRYVDQYPAASAPAYSTYSSAETPSRSSFFDRIIDQVMGVDRQGTFGLVAVAPFALLSMLAGIGLVIAFVLYFITTLNSSGRGLDNDDWEVNHSVWMDQLTRDFEDSWSVE